MTPNPTPLSLKIIRKLEECCTWRSLYAWGFYIVWCELFLWGSQTRVKALRREGDPARVRSEEGWGAEIPAPAYVVTAQCGPGQASWGTTWLQWLLFSSAEWARGQNSVTQTEGKENGKWGYESPLLRWRQKWVFYFWILGVHTWGEDHDAKSERSFSDLIRWCIFFFLLKVVSSIRANCSSVAYVII